MPSILDILDTPPYKDSGTLNLNLISPTIRDFLLKRNLNLAESIIKYGSSIQIGGIGKPAQIGTDMEYVKESPNITEDGELYRLELLNLNRFKNESIDDEVFSIGNVSDDEYFKVKKGEYDIIDSELETKGSERRNKSLNLNKYTSLQDVTKFSINDAETNNYGGVNEGYIDDKGNINFGGPSTNAADIIGSIINGNGVGFSPNGVEPNFDLRSSLAGRVLGAAGIIEDSPLGQIGAQQLAFAMLNNIAFNVQQETLGHINTSVVNFLSGGDIFVPDNDITVPKGGKRAFDIIQKLSGFEIPRSLLNKESDIFSFDSKLTPLRKYVSNGQSLFDYDNMSSQSLVNDTGKGQRNALFENLNASLLLGLYSPTYKDGKDGIDGVQYENRSSNYNGLKDVSSPGEYTEFIWASDSQSFGDFEVPFKTKNSILSKTQDLFKNKKITTMISTHSKSESKNDEINSSVTDNGLMSKGNAVLASDGKTFCRTWTSLERYNKLENLQKHRGLYGNGVAGVRLSDPRLSVLDDNGFVRIAPTKKLNEVSASEIKRFMFSIENLAWMDEIINLRPCEIGPGDGIDYNGKKRQGRIMWFPPYNLTFTDTSSVNWGSTEFIGRGEPVYTYNNTERSGSLSFKMITDHASSYNDFKNYGKDYINQLIFGCEELPEVITKNITPKQKNDIEVEKQKNITPVVISDNNNINKNVNFYFPNDISNVVWSISEGYEYTGSTTGLGVGIGEYNGEYNRPWTNKNNELLNKDFFDRIGELVKLINENNNVDIEILGYASSHCNVKNNKELATNRANNLKNYIKDTYSVDDKKFKITIGKPQVTVTTKYQDALEARKARYCTVNIKTNPELIKANEAKKPIKTPEDDGTSLVDNIISNFYSECSYFDYINSQSELVYNDISNSIREQIRYFQPAFHSITPEGLNSRLNFLLQCTRQGPTVNNESLPSNLAFGRPPVCILRIGDFYHTKIIIDNVDFSFNEVQWDLNPEGIGVQPMLVDVTISFKFIGGSSLSGPIAKLQNAVSFNFFANTEMYDDRADRIEGGKLVNGKWRENEKLKEDNTESTSKKETENDQTAENEKENSQVDVIEDTDKKSLEGVRFLIRDTFGLTSGLISVGLTSPSNVATRTKEYYGTVYITYPNRPEEELIPVYQTDDNGNKIYYKEGKIKLQKEVGNTGPYFHGYLSLAPGNHTIRVVFDDNNKTTIKAIINPK